MMERFIAWAGDYIIGKRWFVLSTHGVVAALLLFAAVTTSIVGLAIFDAAMAGFIIGLGVANAMLPGLFKGINEADKAVMQAQFEKTMNEAIAEIKRQHPEIGDINITRVQ